MILKMLSDLLSLEAVYNVKKEINNISIHWHNMVEVE